MSIRHSAALVATALYLVAAPANALDVTYAFDLQLQSYGPQDVATLEPGAGVPSNLYFGFAADFGVRTTSLGPVELVGLRVGSQAALGEGAFYMPTLDLLARIGNETGLFAEASAGVWVSLNTALGHAAAPHAGLGGGYMGESVGIRLDLGWMASAPVLGLSVPFKF